MGSRLSSPFGSIGNASITQETGTSPPLVDDRYYLNFETSAETDEKIEQFILKYEAEQQENVLRKNKGEHGLPGK